MKKGLIVEQKRKRTLFMTSDGSFYESRKVEGSIGEETTFEPLGATGLIDQTIRWFRSFAVAKPAFAAIIAFLLIIPFYSWLGEDDVHAYMNIDINPSVELSLNDHYEVIDIVGLNEDGNLLIEQLNNWEGASVNRVSSNIIELSNQLGYIEEEHQVLLGISYLNGMDRKQILQQITDEMEASYQSIDIASFEVPMETREQAQTEQTSMNLVYASELIEQYEEEDEQNKEKDSATQSSQDKEENQRNLKVIEKFVEKSKSNQVPPGLKKKVEKFKEKRAQPKEPVEIEKPKQSKEKKDQSNNGKGKGKDKGKGKEKGSDHPSQKSKTEKPGKGNQTKNKSEKKDQPNGKHEDWTPPGHDKKDKSKSNENNGKHKEKSNKPPGLENKGDDHPSQNKGNQGQGQGQKPN